MRGASALQDVLSSHPGKRIHLFVVWEPVIPTDIAPPTTWVLARIPDLRAEQYYDKSRLLSRLLVKASQETPGYLPGMEEMRDGSILWDCVLLFPPGGRWEGSPPRPDYIGATVVANIDEVRRRFSGAAPHSASGL